VDEAVLLSDRIVMMTNGPSACIGEILKVSIPRLRERLELASNLAYLKCRQRVLAFLCEHHRRVEAIKMPLGFTSGSSYRPARRIAFAQPSRRRRPADWALRRATFLVAPPMIRIPNFSDCVAANQATHVKLPAGRASCDVLAIGCIFARVKSMKNGDSSRT
jgi:hypothetical protein